MKNLFINILLFITLLASHRLSAMEAENAREKCNFVIGSNRSGHTLGKFINIIADITQSNTDHKSSYLEYPTITMDICPCGLPGERHIVGDAQKFDFSPYSAQNLYLERFPTFNESEDFFNEIETTLMQIHDENERISLWLKCGNMIGNVLQNISPYMEKGGLLEIEWHPYTLTIPSLKDEGLRRLQEANPFTGYLALEETNSFGLILDQEPDDNFSQQIHDLVRFYQAHGLNLATSDISSLLKEEAKMRSEQGNFSIDSLSFLLQVDIAVIRNQQAVIHFLEEHGFEDLTLSRSTSKRNNRKNVWILQGKKKNN